MKRSSKELDAKYLDEGSYDSLTLSTSYEGLSGNQISVLDKQILNKEVIAKGDREYKKSYVSTTNRAKKKEVLKKMKMQQNGRLRYYLVYTK